MQTTLFSSSIGDIPANLAFTNNFAGTGAPVVGNDSSQNYQIGSVWVFGSSIYICTSAALGAAVWQLLESSGGQIVFSSQTGIAAHAGGAKSGATALTKQISRVVTVASDGDSILAPPATAGGFTIITNGHASNGISVYGAGTDTINEIATATAIYLAAGKTMVLGCALAGAWDGPVTATASTAQAQPSNPTAPASTSAYAMQGLAGAITPKKSGIILLIISGTIIGSSVTAGDGILTQLSYGTGAAPTNSASLTGTQVGAVMDYTNPATVTAADIHVPFSMQAVVTGLTLDTAYWLDLAAKSVANASNVGLSNLSVTAVEL